MKRLLLEENETLTPPAQPPTHSGFTNLSAEIFLRKMRLTTTKSILSISMLPQSAKLR